MFTVLRFWPQKSGLYAVMFQFDKADGTIHEESRFLPEAEANEFLFRSKQQYIWNKLNRFVVHKKLLSEKSQHWSAEHNRASKLDSLTRCLRDVKIMKEYPDDMICRWIITMEQHLMNILPLQYQRDYAGSLKNLRDMLVFSRTDPNRIPS